MREGNGAMRYAFNLHKHRESARELSTKVRDPQDSAFVYSVTDIESGRNRGYVVSYSIEPENTMSGFSGDGRKCRLSVVARFFQGREIIPPDKSLE
jgi:hypothetical protein